MLTYELLSEEIGRKPARELTDYQRVLAAEWSGGRITDDQYERLDALWQARMAGGSAAPQAARPAVPRAFVGSRPRTPQSVTRRRTCAALGYLPPQLAAMFTQGEAASLAIVAQEVAARGTCTLALDAIAARAGVSKTTVKRAMRAARAAGVLTIEERRIDRFNSHTNVVRIISREWTAWLSRRARGARHSEGGGQSVPAAIYRSKTSSETLRSVPAEGEGTGRVVPFRGTSRTVGA